MPELFIVVWPVLLWKQEVYLAMYKATVRLKIVKRTYNVVQLNYTFSRVLKMVAWMFLK